MTLALRALCLIRDVSASRATSRVLTESDRQSVYRASFLVYLYTAVTSANLT